MKTNKKKPAANTKKIPRAKSIAVKKTPAETTEMTISTQTLHQSAGRAQNPEPETPSAPAVSMVTVPDESVMEEIKPEPAQSESDSAATSTPEIEVTAESPPVNPIPEQELTQESNPAPAAKNSFWFMLGTLVFLMVIIIMLAFGYLFLKKNNKPGEKPAPITLATPTPAPSEPAFSASDFIFEVLNGSGEKGAAAKVKKQLETIGYTVVRTGNADKQTYQGTTLYLTEDLTGQSELLVSHLMEDFSDATYGGTFKPDKDSTISARMIIGKSN